MTLCFLCAYSFLCARSHPVGALVFACAFLFVSLVPIYMVQLAPDFFIFAIVLVGYYFWCYKEVAGPIAEMQLGVVAHALAAGAAVGRGRGRAAGRRHVREAHQRPADCAAAGVGRCCASQWARAVKIGAAFGVVAVVACSRSTPP